MLKAGACDRVLVCGLPLSQFSGHNEEIHVKIEIFRSFGRNSISDVF